MVSKILIASPFYLLFFLRFNINLHIERFFCRSSRDKSEHYLEKFVFAIYLWSYVHSTTLENKQYLDLDWIAFRLEFCHWKYIW